MSSLTQKPVPPDQPQRNRALDPSRSILVQAPAGSGKTDLLTRRFLRLLAEVDEPGQVVAITFTNAAAAEMRHRILAELEKAAISDGLPDATDEFSMDALARRALEHSRRLSSASPPSTPFAATWPCSSRYSLRSAAAWASPSSPTNSIAAQPARPSRKSARPIRS